MKEWLASLPDWQRRSLKTFVQAFGGIVITELTAILSAGWPKSWGVFWGVMGPVVASALSTGICAVWNIILEQLRDKEVESNE